MSEAYKAAGVDLELGDELSKLLYRASQETWANRENLFGNPTAEVDSFSGLRSMSIEPLLSAKNPQNLRFMMGDDGVGTKVEVAQRIGDLSTIASDLFAMVCDDAVIKGFEPVAASTTLDVEKLSDNMRPQMLDLALGYIAAAKQARIAVVNGEVAELGSLVGGYEPHDKSRRSEILRFNWSATLLSVGNSNRLMDGKRVRVGDQLVGLAEGGFRSNGLSLVRKTLEQSDGREWHNRTFAGSSKSLGELVLIPSVIYTPVLVDAFGGYDTSTRPKARFHAAAHITGGGIPGKLGRMLEASGLGADISNPFCPNWLMGYVQNEAEITDEEAYKIWNMGQGMIVATDNADKLMGLAEKHGVESKTIGEVTNQQMIKIRSAGRSDGKKLVYPLVA